MTPGCMLTLAPASPLLSLCLSSIASSRGVRLVGGTEKHDLMHGLTFTNTASRHESVKTIACMQLGLSHSPPSMHASMHEDALARTSASDLSAAPTDGRLMPRWWTKEQGPSLIEWPSSAEPATARSDSRYAPPSAGGPHRRRVHVASRGGVRLLGADAQAALVCCYPSSFSSMWGYSVHTHVVILIPAPFAPRLPAAPPPFVCRRLPPSACIRLTAPVRASRCAFPTC